MYCTVYKSAICWINLAVLRPQSSDGEKGVSGNGNKTYWPTLAPKRKLHTFPLIKWHTCSSLGKVAHIE